MAAIGYMPRLNIHGKRIACACILLYGYHPVIWRRPINPYRNPYFQRDPRRYAKPDVLHPKTRKQWDALLPAQKMDARWAARHDGMTSEQRRMRYDLTTWIHYGNQDKLPYPADIAKRLMQEQYASDETRQAIMLDIWFVEDFRDGNLSWEILNEH